MMKPAVIPEFFARLKKAMPEPETELEYDNVYQLLVAVVLSAQATDVGVNRATGPLFKFIKTPQQMVELGEKKLHKLERDRIHFACLPHATSAVLTRGLSRGEDPTNGSRNIRTHVIPQ